MKSVSATELAKLGKCERLVTPGPAGKPRGLFNISRAARVQKRQSMRQLEGDALHLRFEREVARVHCPGETQEALRANRLATAGVFVCLGLVVLLKLLS